MYYTYLYNMTVNWYCFTVLSSLCFSNSKPQYYFTIISRNRIKNNTVVLRAETIYYSMPQTVDH